MNIPPILAALRKHKSGVVLITLQIALTVAIVCNAVFVIGQRVAVINRPTGLDENNLFMIRQMFSDAPTGHGPAAIEQIDALQRADLATLRGLPDVESVAAISSLPLLNSRERAGGVGLKPDQQQDTANAWFYYGGDQVLKTLGLHMVAGRNFTAEEIVHRDPGATGEPSLAIVTSTLASKLFPHAGAAGKAIYFDGGATPTTIVGVVERMQGPNFGGGNDFESNVVLLPARLDSALTGYAVRAKSGHMATAMREAQKALFARDPARVMSGGIPGLLGIQSFSEIRARAYRADRGMAILMGVICVVLLCVTGAGIIGLTSFWVGQRRKQIGIRRALGATRRDILRYFQTENFIIAGGGVVLGAILAVGLNLWLMKQFEMDRMPLVYLLIGVAVMLLIGQGAVFTPALRASRVSPVEATRSV